MGYIEHRIVCPDRTIRWQRWTDRAIFDTSGNVTEYQSVGQDITGEQETKSALLESERRFHELLDLLPQVVFEVGIDGSLAYANHIAFEYFGYSETDFKQGLNVMQMLAPGDRAASLGSVPRLGRGEGGGGYADEYMALKKDGSTFPITIYSSPIVVNERVTGLRGIIVDITEQKQAEGALRESEKRLINIINSMQIGVVIVDALTHTIIDVNDKALELIGADKNEVVGSICHRFICPAESGRCTVMDLGQTGRFSDRILLNKKRKRYPSSKVW